MFQDMGEPDEEMAERHEPDPDHRIEEPHGGFGRESASFSFRPDDEAEDLLGRLKAFDCPYFEERMIPQNSVFREFIG